MSSTSHGNARHHLSRGELDSIHWLGQLEDAGRARAEADLTAREYGPGDYVCRIGEMGTYWLGAIDGLLKVGTGGEDGPVLTYTGMPSGAWFGEGTLLKRQAYRYNVTALRPSLVAALPIETFHWLLDNSVAFTQILMVQFNERLGHFMAARETDLIHNTEIRLARSLLALYNPVLFPGTGSSFSLTQQELAYLVGISRQRVNEALVQLVKHGAVELEYGGVRVVDMEALRASAAQAVSDGAEVRESHHGQVHPIK